MNRVVGIAAGFALGVAATGIAIGAVALLAGHPPADADGSVTAGVFFLVVAFGSLAIFGGLAIAAVAAIFRRWLPDVTTPGAVKIGAGFGLAVVAAASLGFLRPLQTLRAGSGALVVPAAVTGLLAGLFLVAFSAAVKTIERR